MKFNETEFLVLKHAHPDGCGYFAEGIVADRAKELTKEGILKDTEWVVEGWHLTEKGIKYRESFMKKLRKKHGHIWMTRHDVYDDEDKKDKTPYNFAYSVGTHNGFKCKKCSFEFCEHCKTEFSIEECSKK